MLNELALFAGGGGGILGGKLLGWRTRCAVEIDPAARKVLLARQRDEFLPAFPIWDDVRTFDGRPWERNIDVITGGFPCTNISSAGNCEGITGKDSKLFFAMLRIIEEVRPQFVLAENSPRLRTKGLGAVVEGLARLGYVGRYGVLGARHIGANHARDRIWIVASNPDYARKRDVPIDEEVASTQGVPGLAKESFNSKGVGINKGGLPSGKKTPIPNAQESVFRSDRKRNAANSDRPTVRLQSGGISGAQGQKETISRISDWWDFPRFAGMDDGNSDKLDRVRITGNMQVPGVVKLAWEILNETQI